MISITNQELYKLNIIIACVLIVPICLFSFAYSLILFLLLLPIFILTIYSGVQIDTKNKRYRKFKNILFTKRGEWKELKDEYELVILSKSGVKSVIGSRMATQLDIDMGYFELYLMSANHLNRFYLDASIEAKEIKELANLISNETGLSIVRFNPK